MIKIKLLFFYYYNEKFKNYYKIEKKIFQIFYLNYTFESSIYNLYFIIFNAKKFF